VKDSFGCNSAKDTATVFNASKPVPTISGSTSVCEDDLVQYIDPNNVGYSFSWSVTGGTIIGSTTNFSIPVKWGSPGAGSVTVVKTDNVTGCSDTKTVSVIIKTKPSTSKIFH
jgi:hypothetical protein